MLNVGSWNELEIVELAPHGAWLADETGERAFLPNRSGGNEVTLGDWEWAFVYIDAADEPVATLREPLAAVGDLAVLTVVAVTPVGAFVDWGLDKDLFVPTVRQMTPLSVGDRAVVRVMLDDRNNRVYGTTKLGPTLESATRSLQEGQPVGLLVTGEIEAGTQVVIDGRFLGLIHHADRFEPLSVGDERTGFIKLVRADDKVDVTLRRPGYAAVVEGDMPTILAALRSAGGFLPYGDRTDPAEIQRAFKMSKKAFKKAIGGLFRDGLIDLTDDGITLLEPESDS